MKKSQTKLMKDLIPNKHTLSNVGRAGAVMAAAALSLGSSGSGAAASDSFIATAPSLTPVTEYRVGEIKPIIERKTIEVSAAAPVAAAPSSGRSGACGLDYIKQAESGGDYGATSSSGKYRGAYQFDQRTWESTGGSGDPAKASPKEQDARAAKLYSMRGSAPWSVC